MKIIKNSDVNMTYSGGNSTLPVLMTRLILNMTQLGLRKLIRKYSNVLFLLPTINKQNCWFLKYCTYECGFI